MILTEEQFNALARVIYLDHIQKGPSVHPVPNPDHKSDDVDLAEVMAQSMSPEDTVQDLGPIPSDALDSLKDLGFIKHGKFRVVEIMAADHPDYDEDKVTSHTDWYATEEGERCFNELVSMRKNPLYNPYKEIEA